MSFSSLKTDDNKALRRRTKFADRHDVSFAVGFAPARRKARVARCTGVKSCKLFLIELFKYRAFVHFFYIFQSLKISQYSYTHVISSDFQFFWYKTTRGLIHVVKFIMPKKIGFNLIHATSKNILLFSIIMHVWMKSSYPRTRPCKFRGLQILFHPCTVLDCYSSTDVRPSRTYAYIDFSSRTCQIFITQFREMHIKIIKSMQKL